MLVPITPFDQLVKYQNLVRFAYLTRSISSFDKNFSKRNSIISSSEMKLLKKKEISLFNYAYKVPISATIAPVDLN
jgi:hypothetical protein